MILRYVHFVDMRMIVSHTYFDPCQVTQNWPSFFLFFFIWGVSLTHPVLASLLISGVSLTHHLLALFLSGEFVLHIHACWHPMLAFFFFLIWGVSLTHPGSSFFFFFFFFFFFSFEELWRQSLKKRAGWKLAQEKSVKKSHSNQRRKP